MTTCDKIVKQRSSCLVLVGCAVVSIFVFSSLLLAIPGAQPAGEPAPSSFLPVACYMITGNRPNATEFWFGGHRCEYMLAEPFDDAQYARATPAYRTVVDDPAAVKTNNRSLNIFHNHARAWRRALNNTLTIVLEDDALPRRLHRVELYVPHLRPNFVLKLHMKFPFVASVWHTVARVRGAVLRLCQCQYITIVSNAGYVLDSRAAAVLLRHSAAVFEHTDEYIYHLGCARHFNLYGLSENVVEVSGRPSTHMQPHGVLIQDVWTVVSQLWTGGLAMCAPRAVFPAA